MSEGAPTDWPILSVNERRVLGVLVEKQKTTDTYPLTLNALVTGSNQKSNRDPLLDLEDDEVELALTEAQKRGLVMRVISGRVDKWKHLLYETWKVNSVEIAVLAELLLRGPQTEGELRARASRMEEIADLDTLRAVLAVLRDRGLVVYLTGEGRRGTVVTHGFHDPLELNRLRSRISSQPMEVPPEVLPAMGRQATESSLADQLGEARTQLAQLRKAVEELRDEVARLSAAIERIRQELGLSPA